MNISTKKLTKKYLSKVLSLITSEWGELNKDDLSDLTKEFAPLEEYQNLDYYGVFDKKTLIGVYGIYSAKEHPKNVIFIGWFIIHPKYRNKGIGSDLLRKLESNAKKVKKKFIYVVSDKKADPFYAKRGFKKSKAEKLKEFYFPLGCVLLYKKL